jgi:hypothetical protein
LVVPFASPSANATVFHFRFEFGQSLADVAGGFHHVGDIIKAFKHLACFT